MTLSLGNLTGFLAGLNAHIEKSRQDVEKERRAAVRTFVTSVMKNIPVWSGRTIRSLRVSNSGNLAALEPQPDYSTWDSFGQTSKMAMGNEPMRRSAEAIALGELDNPNYDINVPVFITIHSEAWGNVEVAGETWGGPGRNKAIVSEITKQEVRAAHGAVK